MTRPVEYGHAAHHHGYMPPMVSTERSRSATAYFDLSQTLRRLAHRAKREALDWETQGHLNNYLSLRLESDQFWRKSKFYLRMAREWRAI